MELKLVLPPCRLYCKEAAGFLIFSSCFRDDPFVALGKEKMTLEADLSTLEIAKESKHKRTYLTANIGQVETLCGNNAN